MRIFPRHALAFALSAVCGLGLVGCRVQQHSDAVHHTSMFVEGVVQASALRWNDPFFPQQWFLKNSGQTLPTIGAGEEGADINLPDFDLDSASGSEVVVALIDSGIDSQHPDLDASRLFINSGESGIDERGFDKSNNRLDDDNNGFIDDVHGWSFADASPQQVDALGHGTHLAGLLIGRSGNAIGIASPWRSFRLLSLQIFSGSRPSVGFDIIAQAIRYATDMGVKVISASFGSPSPSEALLDALHYARVRNVLVVSAVGNFRKNLDQEPSFPASYRLDNLLSVGASDHRDLAATFTNFGRDVDIFAPGEAIISTSLNSQFAVRSGTSQACPLVAAVAAEIRARHPELSAADVRQRILVGADEVDGLVGFAAQGRRLNTKNALAGVQGRRLPRRTESELKRQDFAVESEHPYRNSAHKTYQIALDKSVSGFRLHFASFSTQSTDVLLLRDSQGKVVQQWSGEMGSFWSAFVAGYQATLEFRTDSFVSDWGWAVDRIELIEP